MALFKKNILQEYNILNYKNDMLILHCSRNDFVRAPFAGKIDKDGALILNDKKLKFEHVKFREDIIGKKIKAGDVIGTPIVEKNMAYIGLSIYNKKKKEDIITYLRRDDVDEKPINE